MDWELKPVWISNTAKVPSTCHGTVQWRVLLSVARASAGGLACAETMSKRSITQISKREQSRFRIIGSWLYQSIPCSINQTVRCHLRAAHTCYLLMPERSKATQWNRWLYWGKRPLKVAVLQPSTKESPGFQRCLVIPLFFFLLLLLKIWGGHGPPRPLRALRPCDFCESICLIGTFHVECLLRVGKKAETIPVRLIGSIDQRVLSSYSCENTWCKRL